MTLTTRPLITIAMAALISGCSSSSPTPQPQATLSAVDSAFILGAGQASNAEIAAAKLAEQKSQNPDVISFAQEMINDHTAENAALVPLAAATGTAAPTGVNAMQQATAQTLMGLAGTAFDAAYVNTEIAGHQMNLTNNYAPEISSGTNGGLVAYAKKYQPQVAMHLQMVQAIKAKDNF